LKNFEPETADAATPIIRVAVIHDEVVPPTVRAVVVRDEAATSTVPVVVAHSATPAGSWPALLAKPWTYLGLSRSAFFRLRSADKAPRPVAVPGCKRPLYRKTDLDKWVERLQVARREVCAGVG
jgi:predicted DNA-binding transcriptional regulator AlpA